MLLGIVFIDAPSALENGRWVGKVNFRSVWRGRKRRETFDVSGVACALLQAQICAAARDRRKIAVNRAAAAGCFHHRRGHRLVHHRRRRDHRHFRRHPLDRVADLKGVHHRLAGQEDGHPHLDQAVAQEGVHLRRDPAVAREDAHPHLDPAVARADGHLRHGPAVAPEGALPHLDPAVVQEDGRHRRDPVAALEVAVRHNRADGRDRGLAAGDSPSVIAGYTKGGRDNNCPNKNQSKTSR